VVQSAVKYNSSLYKVEIEHSIAGDMIFGWTVLS